MGTFRQRPVDIGRRRLSELKLRIAQELRLARMTGGLTQAEVGRRAGLTQEYVSAVERATVSGSLDALCRVAAACGHDLTVRLYPADGVSLRDAGQVRIADAIVREADASWRARLEVAVGDGRAHDLVLDRADEVVAVEIERRIVDLQAQLRAAERKRASLAEIEARPVRLVIALPATDTTHRLIADNRGLLTRSFPTPARRIWRAIRTGRPIGGDGILFVSTVATARNVRGRSATSATRSEPRFKSRSRTGGS